MNRRAFLARSLRLPAAVAALPFLGGLATLAGAGEPEMQTATEPVYDDAVVGWDEGGFTISRYVGGVYQGAVRLGTDVQSILRRLPSGEIRRLTTPWLVR